MSEWTDRAESAAAARGLIVDYPAANELFVDIDDAASLECFHKTVAVLGALVTGFDRKPSPSGMVHRFHVRVRLSRDVTALERCGLQAILGSDRLHEALSWVAAERGVDRVTVFFEKPVST